MTRRPARIEGFDTFLRIVQRFAVVEVTRPDGTRTVEHLADYLARKRRDVVETRVRVVVPTAEA